MISRVAVRAITRAEIVSMSRSWLVRLWVAFALLTALLPVLVASGQEDLVSDVIGGWLAIYFMPSAMIAAILGAGSMTQDADVAVDSILTRAVTRYDYVAAKLLSRVGVVVLVHITATLPTVFLARRFGLGDATTSGLLLSSLAVGAMLVFLTVLGVSFGAVTRNLVFAIAAILVLFVAEGLLFDLFELPFLSPTRIMAELPDGIRGDMSVWHQTRPLLAFAAAAVLFAVGGAVVFDRREL